MKWTKGWLSYLGGVRLEFGGGAPTPDPPKKTELEKKQEKRSLDEMEKTDKQLAAREAATDRSYAGRASLFSDARNTPAIGIPRKRRGKANLLAGVPDKETLG
ncbi:MAG: hypothetical protein KAG66_20670 [Methylococcales bacterium]|nr:hypothetical protein [Methylococcales bacterium]